ncbi:auxin-induced protein 6B-like [Henckelia pumila]|uniref:auxin-induced protein 6B-like n=1 Tax=Henckelia pumila TaxID=405737 RepID=UPI003C6DE226
MLACSRIGRIVWLRQILRRWQKNTATVAGRTPSDVPPGHVAVKVGSSCKRFIVQATYLNQPGFKRLLAQAEEEYGFANIGPLSIPCDEAAFEEIISYLSSTTNSAHSASFNELERDCEMGFRSNLEFWITTPFALRFINYKSFCWF